ncbi:craniofacial development protein 1-like isoform X1 [Biomphalaria glabrata]
MSDDEDYNSEEDVDYVPSEGEQVSEEENSGDDEDLSALNEEDTALTKRGGKKTESQKKKNLITGRKRKGGIQLVDSAQTEGADPSQAAENEEEANRRKELAEQIAKEEEARRQEREKKRVEDLWNSFKSDVKVPVPTKPSAGSGLGSLSSQVKPPSESVSATPESQPESSSTEKSKKITITKVFDFAGEEIKITKEVDADSKEAKAEQKKQEKSKHDQTETAANSSVGLGIKRPAVGGGLGSVLNKITKKNKMGTLEKSKIDWESFKTKEGINDDLKIHNKGKQGYTERMAFLNRTDQRQFEIERSLRLGGNTSKR